MPILLGAALGNVVRGVPLDASGYFQIPLFTGFGTGNPVGILDWYTVLMGVLVLATLTAHGSLFLAWKTQGALHDRCRAAATKLWVAVTLLTLVTTVATAWVSPALYRNFPHSPLAWVGLILFLAGLIAVFAGVRRNRFLVAFLGSGAFIIGILAATAASVWPVMLRSTLDPAWSLTALNGSCGAGGLRAGLKWWVIGFPLALIYFACLFRLNKGKVKAPEEGKGY
jgi:cytochrome d ubiquinol oxidase subunit II